MTVRYTIAVFKRRKRLISILLRGLLLVFLALATLELAGPVSGTKPSSALIELAGQPTKTYVQANWLGLHFLYRGIFRIPGLCFPPPNAYARHRPLPHYAAFKTPLTSFGCDRDGPLLFIGVFSTASRASRRELIRKTQFKACREGSLRLHRGVCKFVIGRPESKRVAKQLELENRVYGDLLILKQDENMNHGKSEAFLHAVTHLPGPSPKFVQKSDDDSILFIPNLIRTLATLDCQAPTYYGSCWSPTCGENIGFPFYYTGLTYGLSYPLAAWIGQRAAPLQEFGTPEDARIGQAINSLPESDKHKVVRLSMDGMMGEWRARYHLRWRANTAMAIHGLKRDEDFLGVWERLQRQK